MTPVHREGNKFSQELCIPCYQTNRHGLLKASAFMDMAQEIAYWAAEALGFGYNTLHIHHTAWVLSRMHIRFLKPIRWRDNVIMSTWHKGLGGLFYLRDYTLTDSAGETAIAATSSWVVIDERTRRFVRPEDLQQIMQVEQPNHAIAEPAPKIILPKEMELVGEHIVTDNEIDINSHTNNAYYVVWATNCLPTEETAKPLKDLYINFNKETLEGESVQLYRLRSGNTWHVEGCSNGKACFSVEMVF